MVELVKALSAAPSGIFGLSVLWAWGIPLVLLACCGALVLAIRRQEREHEQTVRAIQQAECLMAPRLEASRERYREELAQIGAGMMMEGVRGPGWVRFELNPSPATDDASFLRSLGIAPEEP